MLNHFSHVRLFAPLWTAAHQALLSMGFSRWGYWSGLPHPPPGDLLDPGIEPTSFTSPALAGGFFTTSATWEAPVEAWRVPNLNSVSWQPGNSREDCSLSPKTICWQNSFLFSLSFTKALTCWMRPPTLWEINCHPQSLLV